MEYLKKPFRWVVTQFKNHTVRSLLVSISVLTIAAAGIMWACGVFSSVSTFSYLSNREYVLAPAEKPEPQTLEELLHSDVPSVDTLLKNPEIAQELLNAEKLTDIVDSRLALNNLRSLGEQLNERLEEETPVVVDISAGTAKSGRRSGTTEKTSGGATAEQPGETAQVNNGNSDNGADTDGLNDSAKTSGGATAEQGETAQAPGGASGHAAGAGEVTDSGKTSGEATAEQPGAAAVRSGETSLPLAGPMQIAVDYRSELITLKSAIDGLLITPTPGSLVKLPSILNIKGVWQSPDEALIHMVPSGGWLPEEGYKLYRVVNGQKELIAERLASSAPGLNGELKHENADMIKELYIQAELTPDKLNILGMSENEFSDIAYRTYSFESRPRIDGETDFLAMKEALITIPASTEQKIPETDLMLDQPILVSGMQPNGYSSAETRTYTWKKFSIQQAEMQSGIDGLKLIPDGEIKFKTASEVLAARQRLSTLAFVNDEFAEEAGFLIRDDLSALNLPDGAEISYIAEMPIHADTTLQIIKGVENNLTKPQRLMGYGIDGKVPLRWAEAETKQERSILSGYHIERRLDGESEFTRITSEPVVITHMLDETNTYFQSPVFYEDTVENGRTAEYRIYSIDVFGRRSEYSDVCSLKVEKVTPPNAPAAEKPGLIHAGTRGRPSAADETMDSDAGQQMPHIIEIASSLNPNKRGIVLPIFTDSPDTMRFTIYRAEAIGAKGFGKPEVIADLEYNNPEATTSGAAQTEESEVIDLAGELEPAQPDMYQTSVIRKGLFKKTKHALLTTPSPLHPDLIFFDDDIRDGCTYKYWVSAWDLWNNESAWSQSVSIALPTSAVPEDPDELFIAMHPRILYDHSADPPGIIHNGIVTDDELLLEIDLPKRPAPEGAVMETVQDAIEDGVTIGSFLTSAGIQSTGPVASFSSAGFEFGIESPGSIIGGLSYCPPYINIRYDNLPEDKYFHAFLGVRGEDVFPNGTARLKWPAYSGEGLGGYVVYRPLFDAKPLEEMQKMSRYELLRMGEWKRMNETALTQNQLLVSGMDSTPGSLAIFLICLEPETPEESELESLLSTFENLQVIGQPPVDDDRAEKDPEGGYVYVDWDVPDDPQIEYYRVYRSEVPSFKKTVDESKLEWTLVGDRLVHPRYTEKVEQTFAHYYYYKVTSVSPWGVESTAGTVQRFRVPSTKPPQTPNLLLPLQTKDGVKVQFSAVSHCDRYEIHRAAIPRPGQEDIEELLASDIELHAALFATPSEEDVFLTNLLRNSLVQNLPINTGPGGANASQVSGQSGAEAGPTASPQNAPGSYEYQLINPISKLKTLTIFNEASVIDNLTQLNDGQLRIAYKKILDKYGPLALADYEVLSIGMLRRVKWEKIGELPADYDTVEAVDPATGLLKPLSFTDTTARYGITYLYTVQAWNDDNLGSSRPEPVKATPRRNRAFDPIDGLTGEIDETMKPSLKWNLPKMSPLTEKQCIDDTVGYIVYRSDTKDGTYYQASPLLFTNSWVDETADPYAYNWYKVKVLDTGGYLSEFSEPLPVRLGTYVTSMLTDIPGGPLAPEISIAGSSFSITEGDEFTAAYEVTGTEPITVTVKAIRADGSAAAGFSADQTARKINAPSNLAPGTYRVTVTAKNADGEDSASFTLTVSAKPVIGTAPRISFSGSSFKSIEGEKFSTEYELSGTEPITIMINATTDSGSAAKGFSADQTTRRINAPSNLVPGTYRVTVTAKNAIGEDSATFTLTVSAKPVIGTAPRISFDGDSFKSTQGDEFNTVYELSGTEPITVKVKAATADGSAVKGFSVDQSANLVKGDPDLEAGTYHVTVTAKNAAGEDSASFTLTVKAKAAVPPKLADRDDDYSFIMLAGSGDFTIQLSATGTKPLKWSLKSGASRISTLPSEISIDRNGLLKVGKDIKAGKYSFIVNVSNESGSDERVVNLNVMTRLSPIGLNKPELLSNTMAFTTAGFNMIARSGQVFQPAFPASGQLQGLPDTQWQVVPDTQIQGLPDVQPSTPSLDQSSGTSFSQSLGMAYDFETSEMKCINFFLKDVKLSKNQITNLYYGTAKMDIGYDTPVDVLIKDADFEEGGGYTHDFLKKGTVYITEPAELSSIGLTLVSLNVSPENRTAKVSGYIKSTKEGQNLVGDLFVLEFEDAELKPGEIVITEGLPQIRYKQFLFKSLNHITILLRPEQQWDKRLLSMSGNSVFMKSHLETLSNEGLEFNMSAMNFDIQGRMSAVFTATKEQCLQLLVPGGAGLRVRQAGLQYVNGELKPGGYLIGKLVLPFEKATAEGELVPGLYAGGHPAHSEMDDLADGSGGLTDRQRDAAGDMLVHYGEIVQQNSLLILPGDFTLQDECASIPIELRDWDGEGFVVESSTMDSVRVTNRNVDEGYFVDSNRYYYKQRNQAVIVTPTTVSVDLDRKDSLPGQDSSQDQNNSGEILTPKEVGKPFWVGIVINGGKLALPSAYLQQADGKTIEFSLAEGEMIYDLNGFSYQTYLYSSDPEGVPARFGESLGGFNDVRIKDCLLDMYANRVNFEINARVRIDLFHHEWMEAKLFTDEKEGFICSAAPTLIEDGLAKGIDIKIDGGYFEKEGLRIGGQVIIPAPGTSGYEIGSQDPLAFTNMVVPADLEKIRMQSGTNIYASVPLDKPVNINFQGFPMEVRGLDIKYTGPKNPEPGSGQRTDWAELNLHGATQLSDNIALSNESTDSLVVKCADKEVIPTVLYDKSYSVLNNSFEGCIDVVGRLVPKKIQNVSGGLIEFESEELELNFLGRSLNSLPVTHYTRFGKAGDNFYFAVGLTPMGGKPINFGAGNIEKFTGLAAQNMQVGKDLQGRLTFPENAGDMSAYIRNLQVGGGKFAGGIKGEMKVLKLCTIKNLYFGFEPGPKVTAGGDVYVPLDIESIINGNPSRHVGKADIQYRHADRYFSINMTFDRMNIVIFEFGGSLGLEYSPRLFGVYIGYPETLFTNFMLGPIPVHVGVGLGFRIDQDNESMVQAKFEFGLEKELEIAIVYLHGYIYAGADGAYYWGGPGGSRITLDIYLKGGIEGGIKVGSKRYNIISFYLDAHGTLASGAGFRSWEIGCSCTVGYSLDLWVVEIEGSVSASFDTTLAL